MMLASFNISHDLKYRIPFIKEVLATTGRQELHFVCQSLESAGLDEGQRQTCCTAAN